MLKFNALLALSLISIASMAQADSTGSMERCYGVAKAGQNDCETAANAGPCSKSVIDSDPNFFIYVPKGLCTRLTGGLSKNEAGAGTGMDTDVGPAPTTTINPNTTTNTNLSAPPVPVMPTPSKDNSNNSPGQGLDSNFIFPEPKNTP